MTGSADAIERIRKREQEGVTAIYLKCVKCGYVEQKEVFGRFDPFHSRTDSELAELRKLAGIE